jgi:hypothetical protein
VSKQLIPATCGTVGLICLFSPLYLNWAQSFASYQQKQEIAISTQQQTTQIINDAEVDKVRIEQRVKVAKQAAKGKVAVPNRTLRMAAYQYQQGEPPPRISTKGYLSTDRIQVYDATGICIGEIHKNRFTFIDDNSQICDSPPVLNVKNNSQ